MVNLKSLLFAVGISSVFMASAQERSKFKQLEEELPTPNSYRTASGAPGSQYWQQRVDYSINVKLNEATNQIEGDETITYHNNSPDKLTYLWIQLDQNAFKQNSTSALMQNSKVDSKTPVSQLRRMTGNGMDYGCKIGKVTDASGKELHYVINNTMMRVDLPMMLQANATYQLKISWTHLINDTRFQGGRCGMEFFKKDNNYIYEIAQWFPRLCVYSDNVGWQNKQFLGAGEFTLNFGNYDVNITVPSDHVVAATGELMNESAVLSTEQRKRLAQARSAPKPVLIVTSEEADKAMEQKSTTYKTWKFHADNVRDFAFASSRRYIWDAMGVKIGNRNVLAMSVYPKEANPLWGHYSTEVVAHTLKVYSKYTIDYPYPVAISANGPIGGMEYPMISFNGARPEEDGTYSEGRKYALIGVIIHEVGHNFFPMIINSDERQWTWMDEGLNTFVQYLTEKEWDRDYPTGRGPARNIVDYMKGAKEYQTPIMTNSESILQFGNNAYGKPATALNILRETVMGRELFDAAFKEYARRWAFKHPSPSDFFRTMEDASAVDLDWFWYGWFYTVENVDISMEMVSCLHLTSMDPDKEKAFQKQIDQNKPMDISKDRDKTFIQQSNIERNPELKDFYNSFNKYEVTPKDKKAYDEFVKGLSEEDRKFLESGKYFYQLKFKNIGGLVMPIIIEIQYEDGTSEIRRFPVEMWVKNETECFKVIITDKAVKRFVLDPLLETADVNTENNTFPRLIQESHFDWTQPKFDGSNPMRDSKNQK